MLIITPNGTMINPNQVAYWETNPYPEAPCELELQAIIPDGAGFSTVSVFKTLNATEYIGIKDAVANAIEDGTTNLDIKTAIRRLKEKKEHREKVEYKRQLFDELVKQYKDIAILIIQNACSGEGVRKGLREKIADSDREVYNNIQDWEGKPIEIAILDALNQSGAIIYSNHAKDTNPYLLRS